MLGFYDYTVWLTYLSLMSAGAGIIASLHGEGHPFIGIFFLMACGFFDAFDGRVARTKKDRTEIAKAFGIQIDSLADVVAFGILPGCIAVAMMYRRETQLPLPLTIIGYAIILLYMLAALIRLAYFNVMEEERQKTEGGCRKFYEGLPVTSASLIFPTVMLNHYLIPRDLTMVYLIIMLLTGAAFVGKFKTPKPGIKGILIMIGIGLVEFAILALTFPNR